MDRPTLLLLASLALLTTGCAARRHAFDFEPSPHEILVRADETSPVVARVLASVPEARRLERGEPPHMHVRLRVENDSASPMVLVPEEILLVGSDLQAFGDPRIEPAPSEPTPPGRASTFDLWFPYPPEVPLSAPDLTGLNLKLRLAHDEGHADITASFDRMIPRAIRHRDPRVNVSFGFFRAF